MQGSPLPRTWEVFRRTDAHKKHEHSQPLLRTLARDQDAPQQETTLAETPPHLPSRPSQRPHARSTVQRSPGIWQSAYPWAGLWERDRPRQALSGLDPCPRDAPSFVWPRLGRVAPSEPSCPIDPNVEHLQEVFLWSSPSRSTLDLPCRLGHVDVATCPEMSSATFHIPDDGSRFETLCSNVAGFVSQRRSRAQVCLFFSSDAE